LPASSGSTRPTALAAPGEVGVMDMAGAMAQMSAEGFGATRPLASNETEAGRALNRRIDIHVSPRP
jgi:flagellar motor protein MotB